MEKIQQALEKARRTREALIGLDSTQGGPRPRLGRPAKGAVANGVLHFDFQQTRVFEAKPEILQRNRIVAAGEDKAAFEVFRILRTQVLTRLKARGGNAVAVCSALTGEGKTFVATNLAISLARDLQRTALLVDLDVHKPSVHGCFGLRPTVGLVDYLNGQAALEECLVNPGIERLVLLPQTAPMPQASELLASPRMAALAAELKGRYSDRVVVYDCPPLLASNDSLVIRDYADGCLLVVREGKLQRAELVRAAELIGAERFLGAVLNDARYTHAARHYYYYHYK